MRKPLFKVGDKVRLNGNGVHQCFNMDPAMASLFRSTVLTIVYVDPVSMTYPQATYNVEVDNPQINQFLIDDNCFTKVI